MNLLIYNNKILLTLLTKYAGYVFYVIQFLLNEAGTNKHTRKSHLEIIYTKWPRGSQTFLKYHPSQMQCKRWVVFSTEWYNLVVNHSLWSVSN